MTGADKVVCQAAMLLVLFTLTSMPAKAQFAGIGGGGGGGGEEMMTQMAPMLEMMKAKMGKRRFGMMMQTMGPMMSRMMEGGGGGLGGMMGGGGGSRRNDPGRWRRQLRRHGRHRRRRHHGHDRRRWRRRDDEHDPAAHADGQFRRRSRPTSPAAVVLTTAPAAPLEGDLSSVPTGSGSRSSTRARRAAPSRWPPARRSFALTRHASTATSRRCR